MITSSTLRPGLLVGLKTSVRGGTTYHRVDLETDPNVSRWETTRIVDDPEEAARASKARSKARSIVARVCSDTAFGLLCPEANIDLLEAAIADAQSIADEFNKSAKVTRLSISAITGRIARDDVQAVEAINKEVRELLDVMATSIERIDVKAIRDAADKARDVGKMLEPKAQGNVQIAIETARKAANAAAKQIREAGEAAIVEIDQLAIRQIREQRTMFLDLSEAAPVATPQMPAARSVDLEKGERDAV